MEKVYIKNKQGDKVLPVTHVSAVLDDQGNDVGSIIGTFEDEVRGLVDTPHQNYVTVSATGSTTSATSVLPASGQSADTIYRVANWDGSANSGAGSFDVTKYSEYAWDDVSTPAKYVFLCVKSQIDEIFDITVYNNNTKYADLTAALGTGGANIPQSLRRGGMSVKYVQSYDNKYVQYRLMSDSFNTNEANWQGVDDEPTAGSDNLVKSGGVATTYGKYIENHNYIHVITDSNDNILFALTKTGEVHFGVGVPPQIINYIQAKINEYHGDEVVEFLLDYLSGDETLKELLDNTYGKYIENPVWIDVVTDIEDKIIKGFKSDGTLVFFTPVEFKAGFEPNLSDSFVKKEVDLSLNKRDEIITSNKSVINIEDGGIDFDFNYKSAKKQLGIDLANNTFFVDKRYVWVYMQSQAPHDDKHWGMACSVSNDGINYANIKQDRTCVLDMGQTIYGGWLRDPSLIKVGDTFYTAFTYCKENVNITYYGLAKSTDLINWTMCGMVSPSYNNQLLNPGAPEILYIDNKVYVVFQCDVFTNGNTGRCQCFMQELPASVLASENTDVTIPATLIDLGVSTIDHYIVKHNNEYYLFADVNWYVYLFKSSSIYGPYEFVQQVSEVTSSVSKGIGEGYCIFKKDNVYCLFLTDSSYGVEMYKSADLIHWTCYGVITSSYRHGSVVTVNPKVDVQTILNEIL